jgi:uncharacterized protein (DUF433 family)
LPAAGGRDIGDGRRGGPVVNDRVAVGPAVCGGEPCVRGTRVPVQVVVSHLAAGDSEDVILENFPRLTREDIRACLEYAAYLATEKAVPL